MGLIRKTFSVATLGVVPFRSKTEKLNRAERARQSVERRIAAAEERVKHAVEKAAKAARRVEKAAIKNAKSKRGRRHASTFGGVLAAAEPLIQSGAHTVRDAGAEAGRAGRRAGKAARQSAHNAHQRTQRSLRKAAKSTKDVVNPVAARISERVGETLEHVSG